MPFFISPAYSVPPMIAIFFLRLNTIKFSELSPKFFQSFSFTSNALIIVKSGVKPSKSDCSGRINMLFTNNDCHAFFVNILTLILFFSSSPANPSKI